MFLGGRNNLQNVISQCYGDENDLISPTTTQSTKTEGIHPSVTSSVTEEVSQSSHVYTIDRTTTQTNSILYLTSAIPGVSENNNSRMTSFWIPITVVVVVLLLLLIVLIAFCVRKKRNANSKNENIAFKKSRSISDSFQDVVPTAPPQYEEISSSKEIVDNIIYNSKDEMNPDYDHLGRR